MNRCCAWAAFCILLGFIIAPADARYPRSGHGIPGTVTEVHDRFFLYQTHDFGVVKVFISANTNFQHNGQAGFAKDVKPGLTVRVTGGVLGEGIWEAWKVNIVERTPPHKPGSGSSSAK